MILVLAVVFAFSPKLPQFFAFYIIHRNSLFAAVAQLNHVVKVFRWFETTDHES